MLNTWFTVSVLSFHSSGPETPQCAIATKNLAPICFTMLFSFFDRKIKYHVAARYSHAIDGHSGFRANVKQCGHGISLRSLFSQHWFTWTCHRPKPVSVPQFYLSHGSQDYMSSFFLFADILHSVLGSPSECIYNNIVRTCTLSFSCWIQGGRYAKGCGENKWLFSCCVPELGSTAAELMGSFANPYYEIDVPTRFGVVSKLKPKVKQNMLRRRIDDDTVGHYSSYTIYIILNQLMTFFCICFRLI